jgi:hypothetical protein
MKAPSKMLPAIPTRGFETAPTGIVNQSSCKVRFSVTSLGRERSGGGELPKIPASSTGGCNTI